ncbi:MAG: DUF2829 domain-containing protein [Desulfobacterales bacterium]
MKEEYKPITGTMPPFKESGCCEQIIDLENREVKRLYESDNIERFKLEVDREKMKGDSMNFGEAIQALKDGKKVQRKGWNGKDMFIVLMSELNLPPYNTQGTERKVNDRTAKWIGESTPLESQPYIAMFTAQKKWQPGWLASQADMLSDDWEIA